MSQHQHDEEQERNWTELSSLFDEVQERCQQALDLLHSYYSGELTGIREALERGDREQAMLRLSRLREITGEITGILLPHLPTLHSPLHQEVAQMIEQWMV